MSKKSVLVKVGVKNNRYEYFALDGFYKCNRNSQVTDNFLSYRWDKCCTANRYHYDRLAISYDRVIAMKIHDNLCFITNHKFSVTTSKFTNEIVRYSGFKHDIIVSQKQLDILAYCYLEDKRNRDFNLPDVSDHWFNIVKLVDRMDFDNNEFNQDDFDITFNEIFKDYL